MTSSKCLLPSPFSSLYYFYSFHFTEHHVLPRNLCCKKEKKVEVLSVFTKLMRNLCIWYSSIQSQSLGLKFRTRVDGLVQKFTWMEKLICVLVFPLLKENYMLLGRKQYLGPFWLHLWPRHWWLWCLFFFFLVLTSTLLWDFWLFAVLFPPLFQISKYRSRWVFGKSPLMMFYIKIYIQHSRNARSIMNRMLTVFTILISSKILKKNDIVIFRD